jgi:precorrin-6A synthase
MKKVLVIGIGAGNPDYITVQAINAMNTVDVFFVIDKGEEKEDLVRLRREVLARHVRGRVYRAVEVAGEPVRDRSDPAATPDVAAWRRRRMEICRKLIGAELGDGQTGAFLVWGDPSLYDGTIGILRAILADSPTDFDFQVIPGISSVQALAAAHRIPLNRMGEAVQVTTGKRLAAGLPREADNVVVMLDADAGLQAAAAEPFEIYWGAYLGTEDEVLVSGKLSEVADDIARIRKARRAKKGWIMDTYLLRRPVSDQ